MSQREYIQAHFMSSSDGGAARMSARILDEWWESIEVSNERMDAD